MRTPPAYRTDPRRHLARPAAHRGASLVMIVGAIAVVVVAVVAVLLLGRGEPVPTDPEAMLEEVDTLGQKLSLAIQNERDTGPFLAPAEKLVRRMDGFAPAHTLYGQVLMHNGRLEESAAQFQRVLDIDANDPEVHKLLGSVCVKLDDLDAARSHFEQAISLDREDAEVREKLADVELRAGNLDAAQRAALDALNLDSARHKAHALLSQVFEKRGDPDLAEQQMVKALEVLPSDEHETRITYVRRRAAMLRRANKPKAALEALTELPRVDLFSFELAEDVARTYGMMSQPALAAVHYETVSDLDPVNDEAAAQAAAWYIKAGDTKSAKAMTDRLRKINPRHAELLGLEAKASETPTTP